MSIWPTTLMPDRVRRQNFLRDLQDVLAVEVPVLVSTLDRAAQAVTLLPISITPWLVAL